MPMRKVDRPLGLLLALGLCNCNPSKFAQDCPKHYPPLSREAILNGTKPYILGGRPKECVNCESHHVYSQFCRFDLNSSLSQYWADKDPFMRWTAVGKIENCELRFQNSFQARLIDLNEWDMLSMTPCDLWGLIRGRTVWFAGDSMTKDFFKAVECFLYEFWSSELWESMRRKHREHHRDDYMESTAASMRPTCVDLPEGKPQPEYMNAI